MKEIAQAIRAHWGKRCKEFSLCCVVCRVWREYDKMVAAYRREKRRTPNAQ